MSACYVATSVLAGIAFGEPAAERFAVALNRFDRLLSSNLLEAEIRAIFQREGVTFEDDVIAGIDWVLPARPLSVELAAALAAGDLRGAELLHVATALYVAPQPDSLTFATLDVEQARAASALGFPKCRI